MSDPVVTLVVRGAEKRDAGRGVARLPESARRTLGVLSGDTVLIEGERMTVAKVWPAASSVPEDVVQIDADTRANAGVSIGDEVTITKQSVKPATAVTITPPVAISETDADRVARAVKADLRDRPVTAGARIRIEHLGVGPFTVTETDPDGSVRIVEATNVTVPAAVDAPSEAATDRRISYEDIGGLDEELELVREMIELPLSEPELFHRVGIDPPRGVLLYGPPGTGKTLIARAVANEVDAEFHHVSGPEIMSKYKGESEEQLRSVFEDARESAPSIIFFDEIDSVAGAREDGGSDVENRIVAQLLSLMDGLEARGNVVVIGATNRIDVLDPALRRGGRFDREIEIGVPNEVGRREIFEVHTRGMPLEDDVSLDQLAGRTYGFVGADVHSLATEAGMNALRRFRTDRNAPLEELTVTRADFEQAMATVEPSAMREFIAETPSVRFDDIGGLDDAKATLREAIEWPLAYTALFERTNTDPPSGVLLYGPPGTGKTMLARAVARESGVNFIHVAGPELIDKYVGESERAVRKVFERARQSAPSIVFFDEIDAIAGQRGTGGHEVTERVVSQLLTELDSLAENPNLVVLAATNRRDILDRALLRPGRLETHIEVPEPDLEARRIILAIHTEGKPMDDDVDLELLAERLTGFTGADIAALIRAASMLAIRSVADRYGPAEAVSRTDEVVITEEHIERAMANLGISAE